MSDRDGSAKADDRTIVLPFYLLVDVSGSMSREIPVLNQALRDFRDALALDPILGDTVRFGVLDFAGDARVVVPLGNLAKAELPPTPFAVRDGGTGYAAAFRKMREVIDHDARAKGSDVRYFRSAVFFLTDGEPTDEEKARQAAFRELTYFEAETRQGNKRYPLFVPFGFRDAKLDVLSKLAHPRKKSKVFMAKDGTTAASAIEAMLKLMLNTVMESGYTASSAHPEHRVAKQEDLPPEVECYEGGDFPDDDD